VNPLQLVWALGIFALVFSLVEQFRGTEAAPTDVKLKLRALWRGWPGGAYGRYAFHEAPEPSRGRLRRSAWANVAFVLCWALGMSAMGGWLMVLVAAGVAAAGVIVWSLVRRSGAEGT
jgi:hypothetical protein